MSDETNDGEEQRPAANLSQPDESRRRFMVMGMGFIGTAVAGVTLAPAAKLMAHPLTAESAAGQEVFIDAGSVAQFSATPVKVDLYSDKVDAWNRVTNVKIGSAWVVERGGELIAMSTVCPHLGCAIDYDAEGARFVCPCHDSYFDLDGKETEGPSPRAMDRLELVTAENLVRVKHQRFKQGTPDKEPV
ncbi:MAG: ubiquinol-cytochrome c reductase iron-sulfur subunit [Myxococcota bacterium]